MTDSDSEAKSPGAIKKMSKKIPSLLKGRSSNSKRKPKQVESAEAEEEKPEAIDEDEKASKRRSKRKDASQIMKRNNMNDLTNSISRYIVDIIN